MLKVPPWHQELQPVLFALAGLPLYYLQIARYCTATSCTHMNLQQFLRHYIADEHYISENTRPLQSQLKRSLKRRAVGGSIKRYSEEKWVFRAYVNEGTNGPLPKTGVKMDQHSSTIHCRMHPL